MKSKIYKTGRRASVKGRPSVTMFVWNSFTNDARVLREAQTLMKAGYEVVVVGVAAGQCEISHGVLPGGIVLFRVPRRNGLGAAIMSPRLFVRRVVSFIARRMLKRQKNMSKLGVVRWWQFDRKLAFFTEELAVNWRMFRVARDVGSEVAHSHDVDTLFPAWLVSKISQSKLVYDAHEISADREGFHGRVWLIKLVEQCLGARAHGIITTTKMRADWFRRNYGYSEVVVLQNRPVRRIVSANRSIRDSLGVREDQLLVIYQGGLQWGRGLRNLLEAVRGLPSVVLVYVGDGVQRHSLEREAAELYGRVHFVGSVPLDQLPGWTASADIGVQCIRNTCLNHYTTDSNKLFEYIMGGLPVIASDFPEIRHIVEQYDLGILVNPDSVEQIREALRHLIENPELRIRFAANARRARNQLDWASQEPVFLALYKRIISSTMESD